MDTEYSDEQEQQSSQQDKKRGLIHDSRNIYKWGKRARHPKETLKKGKEKALKILKTLRTNFNRLRMAASFSNPWVIGIIFIILLIIILFFFLFNDSSSTTTGGTTPPAAPLPPGLTINIDPFDAQVSITDTISYNVHISYDPSVATSPLSSIVVYDTLPPNTEFVSATNPPCTLIGNTIDCPLAGLSNETTIVIVLKPTKNDTIITNTIGARIEGSVLGEDAKARTNNCDGAYDLSPIPLQKNFGDPDCDFSKDNLFSFLKLNDPRNASFWYYEIAACSGYNPNFYSFNPSTGEEFYGIFKLQKSQGGQVPWKDQANNAILYSKTQSLYFSTWECSSLVK